MARTATGKENLPAEQPEGRTGGHGLKDPAGKPAQRGAAVQSRHESHPRSGPRHPSGTPAARPSGRTAQAVVSKQARNARNQQLEVEKAMEKNKALQAEVEALEAEVAADDDATEAAVAEAERARDEFTNVSAELLREFVELRDRNRCLAEALAAGREEFEGRRSDSLRLAQRSLALDREHREIQEKIDDSARHIEECADAQGSLDAELVEQLAAGEDVRNRFEAESRSIQADQGRFQTMRERLLEVSGPSPSPEADELLEEADAVLASLKQRRHECDQAASERF